ncbi:HIT domain-containing protein [Gilvimarinus agarilyticus]|uniref:HIT domain-containing protein n=1 Tax=unclassified Gilvimarinus TaxID=2642066 RepID=UPI001C096243|nr:MULTISPECIES: HIT domain-containing protein [unclassified Gilvimarinus]MBU2885183.1 HIT domain-containing protein [Gilvimarinus agarilyticus]MDO6570082.1 HIT domain-containing protein [Gilvimarinus sp. 2_MG-2023]MDO6745633.1 HIT domain-containing protein [Gilvimarinus sp. 1_MG-2023]
MFSLDSRLRSDSFVIGRFELSLLLLARDANYPWFILVPERANTYELYHLAEEDQKQLIRESSRLAEVMHNIFDADKLNIATLGNVIPQLHVHHVARFESDPAWPGPIWGKVPAKEYPSDRLSEIVEKITNALAGEDFHPIREGDDITRDVAPKPVIDC